METSRKPDFCEPSGPQQEIPESAFADIRERLLIESVKAPLASVSTVVFENRVTKPGSGSCPKIGKCPFPLQLVAGSGA